MIARGIARFPLLLPTKPPTIPRCRMSGDIRPNFPKFISLEDADNTKDSTQFRLISYNILAQAYVKSSYFPHSPRACLKWKTRSEAVLTILKSFDSDFLCLQELDELESFYKRQMETHGYFCVYMQRSGQKRDGCGIFYRSTSAELLLKEEIEYNDLVKTVDSEMAVDQESADVSVAAPNMFEGERGTSKIWSVNHGNPRDPCIRLKRDCVGLLAAFKLKSPCQHVIILANTHIYWDPEFIDVKLAQVEYLLFRLAQFKEVISEKFKCTPSVIVAGDFNSTPGDKVYERLVSKTSSSNEAADRGSNISLKSLYASIGGEPPFTNCTPDFTGTLDYIFFSDAGILKPVSFLRIPDSNSEDVAGGLPNHYHPSDHLPIGADFDVICL